MNSSRPNDQLIAEQAMQWREALKTGGPAERAAFADWLLESRRNVRNFMLLSAFDEELGRIDPQRQIDVDELIAQSRNDVVPLRQGAGPELITSLKGAIETSNAPTPLEGIETSESISIQPEAVQLTPAAPPDTHDSADSDRLPTSTRIGPRRHWAWVSGIAACACAGALALQWFSPLSSWGWKDFSTVIGEQRVIELEDGSIVHLNTSSHVQVRLTANARDIRLVDGEALFKVQHDPSRPFRVHTSDVVIQAIGTQFDVYRRSQNTTVAVLEGVVRISAEGQSSSSGPGTTPGNTTPAATPAPTVSAGEEADIGNGKVSRRANKEITNTVAWRQRRLVFREDKLSFIVGEFNRYNRSPQFHVKGDVVGDRRYTGVFDADDPTSLEQLLRQESDLLVERHGREIEIRARTAPGEANDGH